MPNPSAYLALLLASAVNLATAAQAATQTPLPHWQEWTVIDSQTAEPVAPTLNGADGASILTLLPNQRAYLSTVQLSDFVLDVDITARGMAGIGFRAQSLFDYDYLFFRTTTSDADRTIQYLPVFNGAVAWHLYPHYQASAEVEPDETFHVTLRCVDRSCRVSVGGRDEYEFLTERDRAQQGFVMLRSSFGEAQFSNLRLTEVPASPAPHAAGRQSADGNLNDWVISPQVDLTPTSPIGAIRRSHREAERADWMEIKADDQNVINLAKYFEHPNKGVFARAQIRSPAERDAVLEFDYTHFMTILFNGEIVFSGRELDTGNSFRVSPAEQSVPLHLKSGTNELVFLIFGYDLSHNPPVLGRHQYENWGFTARLAPAAESEVLP